MIVCISYYYNYLSYRIRYLDIFLNLFIQFENEFQYQIDFHLQILLLNFNIIRILY